MKHSLSKQPGRRGFVLIAWGVLFATQGTRPALAGSPIDFDREIRPILSEYCYACHGPDQKARKADLRLDRKEDAFRDRSGYAVVVPGRVEESELIQRVTSQDADEMMPPPKFKKRPSSKQIDLLSRWIKDGAKWEGHWSYTLPASIAVPPVRDRRWPRNSIDHFVLARLESEGAVPSPEADRATLIRRVSLDLAGLPPLSLKSKLSRTTKARTLMKRWSAGCWRRPILASDRRTLARPGALCRHQRVREGQHPHDLGISRLGDPMPSTAICRSINSRSSKSPAICCRVRPRLSVSPPASIATRSSTPREASTTRNSGSPPSSIASIPQCRSGWVARSRAPNAMTTSTTPLLRKSIFSSLRSSTTRPTAAAAPRLSLHSPPPPKLPSKPQIRAELAGLQVELERVTKSGDVDPVEIDQGEDRRLEEARRGRPSGDVHGLAGTRSAPDDPRSDPWQS